MAEYSVEISEKGCINFANQLIDLCDLPFPKILSINNINSSFFVALFEHITGLTVPDLRQGNDSVTEAHNIQAFIDTLSLDILNISLSHITGEDVVSRNFPSILCLLEILKEVYLQIRKKKDSKQKCENDYKTVPTKHSFQSEPIQSTSSDKVVSPVRVLRRKTCRNTLRKPHVNPHTPSTRNDVLETEPGENSQSKRHTDTVDRFKSPMKRKIIKQSTRTVKRPHTGIEDLHDMNFESKIRILLHSDKSPTLRAQQLKKRFIQSLQAPLKKKPLSPCKKSFLLPHYLQRKRISSVQRSPTRGKNQSKKSVKKSVSENAVERPKKEDEAPAFIKSVLEEFPGFQFPKNTQDLLTKQYCEHVSLMHKQLKNALLKKPPTAIQMEKAMEDEAKLSKVLVKDLKEKKHLRELNEHKEAINKVKYAFRDARIRSAKTRQYFDEFHKAMSKKMKRRNFSEEVLIEKTLKELIDIEKKKVQELCRRVRETGEQDAVQQRQYLSSLKNLYQNQLSIFEELISTEQKESAERAKAQKLAVEKMNREARKNLLKEVRNLQKDILVMMEDIHFRELDAENCVASFQQRGS